MIHLLVEEGTLVDEVNTVLLYPVNFVGLKKTVSEMSKGCPRTRKVAIVL